MPDLPALIKERLDAGDTLQRLEQKSGGVVKYQRWGQLSRGERLDEFPKPETLGAIARALGQSETIIVIATARALGMNVTRRGSAFAQRVPAAADNMPEYTRTAILRLIEAVIRDSEQIDAGEVQEAAYTPPQPPGPAEE